MKNNVQVKNALTGYPVAGTNQQGSYSAAYPQMNGNGSFTYNAKIPVSLVRAISLVSQVHLSR
jgi:hypothetical protein